MTRILMASRGTEGDVRPMIQVGKGLVARSHEVVMITHCVFEQSARAAGLDFASIDSPGEYEQWLVDFQQIKSMADFYPLFQRYSLPLFPRVCTLLEEHTIPGDTLMVVGVNAYVAARTVSEKLNIPIATYLVGPGYIVANAPLRTARRELSPVTPSAAQLMLTEVNQYRAAMGLPAIADLVAWWNKDNLNLAPWPSWFASLDENWQLKIIQTGFLPSGDPDEPLPPEAETLLADGSAPILLTGGTGVFVGENYYGACLEACRRLGRRVILVARRQAGLPSPLPAGVRLFSALPFASLMPRVAAVIHHGGLGTTVQALAAGAPQLILAQGLDRLENALRVERLGAGKLLPPRRWEPDSATRALAGLLDKPEMQARCQELARRIREQDGLAAVIEAIESIAPNVMRRDVD